MIYCVVPPELEEELYEKLCEYYKDNPNVQVIIDRRAGPDPRAGQDPVRGSDAPTPTVSDAPMAT